MTVSGRAVDQEAILAGLASHPDVAVRLYVGQPIEAASLFSDEAPVFAANGYMPVSQTWAEGNWSPSVAVVAVLLLLIAIGVLFLAYMLVARPSGVLTVVYRPLSGT